MKKRLSHHYCYILCLAIFLGTHACECNSPTSPQTPSPTKPIGFWHTYIQEPDLRKPNSILHPVNRGPNNTNVPAVYNRKYTIYPVVSNGNCAYLAFIPILLADILVQDKWKGWIEDVYNTLYKPAQEMIEKTNWPADNYYVKFSPTNDLTKLYIDTKNLLQKLSSEATPRKLYDEEAKLLVDFLRQCILMQLINTNKSADGSVSLDTINNKLKGAKVSRGKLFWAGGNDFQIFNVSYAVMLDEKSTQQSAPGHNYYRMDYYSTDRNYVDGTTPVGKVWKTKEEIPQPNIMMYYNNGDHYDYIIAQ